MEETSKHGVLGRHQTCSKERIEVLSDTIECIILHETLPTHCIPKVVRMEIGEVIHEKVYASPRPPPKISLKHDLMKELGPEVARQAEGSQPTQPNPNPNHDRTGRPVVAENTSRLSNQEINSRFSRDCKNAKLEEEEEANHDRTERPVVIGQPISSSSTINEVDIDFKVSGFPHSVVKRAENSRVRELVKKIENHPHRQDLQADLQQSNAYNPLSEKSKKMDLLSIPNYVIKKGRPHINRHVKTKEQRDHFIAHNLKRRCHKSGFQGIHDRFLKKDRFRESQLEHDRTEEVWIQMDKDAQKDFTYRMSQDEYFRYKKELVDLSQ